jgi:Predicted membrane protein
MRVYFSLGTHTYYGKAAAVPLVALWIHIVWIVVILGAEVSFLIEHERDLLVSADESPTFREGRGLLFVLSGLYENYRAGREPATFDRLTGQTGLSGAQLKGLMEYLKGEGWVVEVADDAKDVSQRFVLAKDPAGTPVSQILLKYCTHSMQKDGSAIDGVWQQSLEHWAGFYKNATVADLSASKAKRKS